MQELRSSLAGCDRSDGVMGSRTNTPLLQHSLRSRTSEIVLSGLHTAFFTSPLVFANRRLDRKKTWVITL